MLGIIAECVGWCATVFRAWGMLVKNANLVKYLVSIGNFLWLCNGIMTGNAPLIASNGICLVVMIAEIVRNKKASKK